MGDPLFVVLPGPEVVLVNEAANRRDVGAAVVANLADEMCGVVGVEVALEVVARSPEMLLGHPVGMTYRCRRDVG